MKKRPAPKLDWYHPYWVDEDGWTDGTRNKTVLYSVNGNWGITRERDANYALTGKWLLFWTGRISGRKLRGISLTGFFKCDVATGLTLRHAKRLATILDRTQVYTPKRRAA